MKLKKTIDFLDFLVKPMHLKVVKMCRTFVLFVDVNDLRYESEMMGNVDKAFEHLFKNDVIRLYDKGIVYGKTTKPRFEPRPNLRINVNNPYFNCRSLEEAMIRRDLMRDED